MDRGLSISNIWFFPFVCQWWVFVLPHRRGSPVDTYTRRHSTRAHRHRRAAPSNLWWRLSIFNIDIHVCFYSNEEFNDLISTPFLPYLGKEMEKATREIEHSAGFITITFPIVPLFPSSSWCQFLSTKHLHRPTFVFFSYQHAPKSPPNESNGKWKKAANYYVHFWWCINIESSMKFRFEMTTIKCFGYVWDFVAVVGIASTHLEITRILCQLNCVLFALYACRLARVPRIEIIVYNICGEKANNYDIVVVSYFIITFGDNSLWK